MANLTLSFIVIGPIIHGVIIHLLVDVVLNIIQSHDLPARLEAM